MRRDGMTTPREGERGYVFEIEHHGEAAAGIHGFSDTVHVIVGSGDPGGDPGEFIECVRAALAEWYDGVTVLTEAEDAERRSGAAYADEVAGRHKAAKRYVMRRLPGGRALAVVIGRDGVERSLRHVMRHSPTGFEWGYGGSGPADLALSICVDLLEGDVPPLVYQDVKWRLLEKMPKAGGELHEDEVREAIAIARRDLGATAGRG